METEQTVDEEWSLAPDQVPELGPQSLVDPPGSAAIGADEFFSSLDHFGSRDMEMAALIAFGLLRMKDCSPNDGTVYHGLRTTVESSVLAYLQETPVKRRIISDAYSAYYLPQTVAFAVNLANGSAPYDDVETYDDMHACVFVLHQLSSRSLYFIKYMRSASATAAASIHLPSALGTFVLRHGTIHGLPDREVYQCLYLLFDLYAILAKESTQREFVRREIAVSLAAQLVIWSRDARITDPEKRSLLYMCICCVTRKPETVDMCKNLHRPVLENLNWKKCSFTGCSAESPTFKKCGKCLTVRYCSAEHQREHWKLDTTAEPPHKDVCFATQY